MPDLSRPPASLADFQQAFAGYLRGTRPARAPAGLQAGRPALYHELCLQNLRGPLDACFPVLRQTLGEPRWERLLRQFLRLTPLSSPWFSDIPAAWVAFLHTRRELPPWVSSLAHYEWMELVIDLHPAEVTIPEEDLAHTPLAWQQAQLRFNPTAQLLTYDWPVQRIGPHHRPLRPALFQVLVFRTPEDRVRFVEINPATAHLLRALGLGNDYPLPTPSRVPAGAPGMGAPLPENWLDHAAELLNDLQTQHILWGITS